MDKSWMDKKKGTREYFEGVKRFVEFASLNARHGKIPCPCIKCVHSQLHPAEVVRGHLNNFGILSNYRTWTMHGESQSTMTPAEVRSSHEHENLNEYGNFGGMLHNLFAMHDMAPESMDEGPSVQQPTEDPSVQQPAEGPNDDAKKFYKMIEDVEKPLYKGCTKFSIFSAVVVLYQLKSLCGWSNKSFTLLLQVVQDLLPLDATLPKDCYEAKKIVKDLGLGYEKIHACTNDCMLFWKQDANLEACKFCGVSRWKEQNTTSGEPNNASSSKGKKKAAKMLRWFPLKPRLQRLFLSPDLAGYMKWHATGRSDDGIMRHPADSEAWKMFDTKYVEFSSEPRNVRLGLASDGFNPYGIMSTSHSTWPVVLIPYNLPPWMCMKRSSLILSLVVPGPSSPGIAIDVYLQPLIEELRELWDIGVEAYDASSKNRFQLRAALMWTINDFPAYSDLSGWSTKGMFACPSCASDTDSRYLKHGHKFCYMGHRRWLERDHPFRKEDTNFDGTQDMRLAPEPPSGLNILMDTGSLVGRCLGKKAQATFKKRKRGEENVSAWNKRSILFTLPYWRDHKLRHNLDVMHIEKNVTDNIIGTLLSLKGKTKDNPKARLDLQAMGIRSALHLKSSVGDKYTMPHACFNMNAREKDGFLQVLRDVRVPDGYASNISRRVNLKDRTISGLKSHDNHILMQQLLPIALRGSLPASVTRPLMKLSCFFREICSKTLKVSEIENLEKNVAVTLCELEKIFPPSFFTVMVHLVIHLATEAKMCGPVHYRWMYPIERYLSRLKSYVRNRAAPEGSIAEGYYVEECLTFCARYMEGVETIFNRPTRLIEGSTGAVSSMQLMNVELTQAHRYILFSSKEITKFIEMHRKLVEEELQDAHCRISEDVINKRHMEQFCSWLRHHILEGGMGRKRQLQLVESGQCSSHAIGSQQEETRDAALDEDIPHGATHDDDATQPPDDVIGTPTNVGPRAKRGRTLMRDIWNLPPGTQHVLHLNGQGQPIGSSGATFKRWLGTITRKYYMCPVVPTDWRELPIQYKRECWGEIERRWAIPADKVPLAEQENWAMQLLGNLRRAHRTFLKKTRCLEGMSPQQVLNNIPNNCDEEQWKKLVEYWFTKEVQDKALQNKASRGFQEEIPTTGPRSLAQLVAIMENETGGPVERAVVYNKAYSHKDGTPVSSKAADNIKRMRELLNAGTQLTGESSHGGGILWAPDDAYAQVMGQERRGRIRGVGFGPTPSSRKAKDVLPNSTTPQQSYANDQRVVELEDQIATLTHARVEDGNKIDALTQARVEDANKIEALTRLVTLERTQRIERDAEFKKMMDSFSQNMRALQSQSEEDAHADVDDGDELDDGDALDGSDRFF